MKGTREEKNGGGGGKKRRGGHRWQAGAMKEIWVKLTLAGGEGGGTAKPC